MINTLEMKMITGWVVWRTGDHVNGLKSNQEMARECDLVVEHSSSMLKAPRSIPNSTKKEKHEELKVPLGQWFSTLLRV